MSMDAPAGGFTGLLISTKTPPRIGLVKSPSRGEFPLPEDGFSCASSAYDPFRSTPNLLLAKRKSQLIKSNSDHHLVPIGQSSDSDNENLGFSPFHNSPDKTSEEHLAIEPQAKLSLSGRDPSSAPKGGLLDSSGVSASRMLDSRSETHSHDGRSGACEGNLLI
jgi:hypothetical protein